MSFQDICCDFDDSNELIIASADYYKGPCTGLACFDKNKQNQNTQEENELFNNLHRYADFEDDVNERFKDDIMDTEYDMDGTNVRINVSSNRCYQNYINEQGYCASSDDEPCYSADCSDDCIIYGLNDADDAFDNNIDNNDSQENIQADIFLQEPNVSINYDNDADDVVDFDLDSDDKFVPNNRTYQLQHNQTTNADVNKNINVNNLSQQACFNGGVQIIPLEKTLNDNIETKSYKLVLQGQHINGIPIVLKNFTWVRELIIRNTKIQKLDDLPPNLTDLIVESNLIPLLNGSVLPNSLINLKFTNNKTLNIINLKEGLIDVNLSYNDFSEIRCCIPSTVQSLMLSYNKNFVKMPIFENDGENLRLLDLSSTGITDIDDLPHGITELKTSQCPIITVSKLPRDLITWKSFKSRIKTIRCDFPEGLTDFDISDSCLESCPNFNNQIKTIDLSSNMLITVPDFPHTAFSVDVRDNYYITDEEIMTLEKSLPKNMSFFGGNTSSSPVETAKAYPSCQYSPLTNKYRNSDTMYAPYQYGLNVNNRIFGSNICGTNSYNGNEGSDFFNQGNNFWMGNNFNRFVRYGQHNNQLCNYEPHEYSESNPHYIVLPKRAITLE